MRWNDETSGAFQKLRGKEREGTKTVGEKGLVIRPNMAMRTPRHRLRCQEDRIQEDAENQQTGYHTNTEGSLMRDTLRRSHERLAPPMTVLVVLNIT